MEITEELFFNIIKDWEKKEIRPEEKGRLIRIYKEETGKSYRDLEKEFNIHHNTLQDWVTGRQMKKYYKNKKNELNTLLDRVLFLLTRTDYNKDEKTVRLLNDLKKELEKMII